MVGYVRPGCGGRVRQDAAGGVEGASVLYPSRPVPSGIGAGQGGSVSLMFAAAVPESITIPAVPEQVVRAARAFAAGLHGESRA